MNRRAFLLTGAVSSLLVGCGTGSSATTVPVAASEPAAAGTPSVVLNPGGSTVANSTLGDGAAFMGPIRTLQVGSITLAYRQFGAGEPVVGIMGQDGSIGLWDLTLMEKLSRRFNVVIFDNRGVGLSTDDSSVPLTIPLMASDTARLITALGFESAHVLGWSMGGEIALALAAAAPTRVRRVVVSGATAGGPTEVPPTQAVIDILASPTTTPAQLFALLFPASAGAAAGAYGANLAITRPEQLTPATQQRQSQAEFAFFQDSSVYDALPSVTVPILVTYGAQDVLVPPANGRVISSRLARGQSDVFDDAGHAMLFQDIDRFNTALTRFLTAT